MALPIQFKVLFILFVLMSTQSIMVNSQNFDFQAILNFAKGFLCFSDADCSTSNCVLFLCKPQACRCEADCSEWGFNNYFCINQKLTFFGTECVPKRGAGNFCTANNECLSGTCSFFQCK